MSYQDRDDRMSANSRFSGAMHLGMGILYIILAGFVITVKSFGSIELGATMAYVLGGLLLVYGLFRFYRGFDQMRRQFKR
jgi:uncharacterized membrane protein YidH (DUF202 family)